MSTVVKPRNEGSQEKVVLEDRWHGDRGTYSHLLVVSKAWCLKGTVAPGWANGHLGFRLWR